MSKKPYQKRPIFLFFASFIGGILLYPCCSISLVWVGISIILCLFFSLLTLHFSTFPLSTLGWLSFLFLCLGGSFVGYGRSALESHQDKALPSIYGEGCALGVISKPVEVKAHSFLYTLKLLALQKQDTTLRFTSRRANPKVKLYARRRTLDDWAYSTRLAQGTEDSVALRLYFEADTSPKFRCFDTVLVYTNIQPFTTVEVPDFPDFPTIYARQGVYGQAFCDSLTLKPLGKASSKKALTFLSAFAQSRCFLAHSLETPLLTKQSTAMLKALLLGDKKEVNKADMTRIQEVGVAHVMAISGLHIGLIFGLLLFLFRVNGNKQRSRLKYILALLMLWAYVFMIACPISALRAVLMLTIFTLYYLTTDAAFDSLVVLCLSATYLLMINPSYVYGVGFQMSYMAMFGLLFVMQPFSLWYRRHYMVNTNYYGERIKPKRWRKILYTGVSFLMVTLVAQTFVLPLILHYFHYGSSYFLVSSLTILPLVTLILYLGLAFLVLGHIPLINSLLAFSINHLFTLFSWITVTIRSWPHAMIYNWFTVPDIVWYYVFLMVLVLTLMHSKAWKWTLSGFLLVGFIGFRTLEHHTLEARPEVLTVKMYQNYSVNILTSEENWLVSTDTTVSKDLFENHWLHRGARRVECLQSDRVAETTLMLWQALGYAMDYPVDYPVNNPMTSFMKQGPPLPKQHNGDLGEYDAQK